MGILFALVCAFLTNLAFLFKHRGANAAPTVDIRYPIASAAGLFRSRWFAIGWLVAVVAWVFHVLALALAPMSIVQVVLAGGLVLLAVMADRLFGFTVGKRQWVGLIAMAVGLGLITVTQPPVDGSHSSYSVAAMAGFEGGLLVLAALLIVVPRAMGVRAGWHGLALGAASGVLFGVSDVALKALLGLVDLNDPLRLASPWALIAIAASVSAFYASARGLQDGDAVSVIAVTGTAANIVGILGGIVVFGDPMPGDKVGLVLQVVAFVLVVVAAALTPAPVRAARIDVTGRGFATPDDYIQRVDEIGDESRDSESVHSEPPSTSTRATRPLRTHASDHHGPSQAGQGEPVNLAGLQRPASERLVFGVCAGLARSLGVNVLLVRAASTALLVVTGGVGVIAYGALVCGAWRGRGRSRPGRRGRAPRLSCCFCSVSRCTCSGSMSSPRR